MYFIISYKILQVVVRRRHDCRVDLRRRRQPLRRGEDQAAGEFRTFFLRRKLNLEETLPKAQRTRGLSSYHKLLYKS